jgi:hypothetical protein
MDFGEAEANKQTVLTGREWVYDYQRIVEAQPGSPRVSLLMPEYVMRLLAVVIFVLTAIMIFERCT